MFDRGIHTHNSDRASMTCEIKRLPKSCVDMLRKCSPPSVHASLILLGVMDLRHVPRLESIDGLIEYGTYVSERVLGYDVGLDVMRRFCAHPRHRARAVRALEQLGYLNNMYGRWARSPNDYIHVTFTAECAMDYVRRCVHVPSTRWLYVSGTFVCVDVRGQGRISMPNIDNADLLTVLSFAPFVSRTDKKWLEAINDLKIWRRWILSNFSL